MVSSARHAIASVLVVLWTAVWIQAQTTTPKVARGIISGKVTSKGKPAAGVVVIASDPLQGLNPMSRHRARTDQTGSYRITNLPAGTYGVSSITPALVPANQSDSVVLTGDDEVENVNIVLVPGGVITGKITDAEGEPVIGEHVNITPVYEQLTSRGPSRSVLRLMYGPDSNTDDRGIYRIFGLPPGKYKVSVGESSSGRKSSREYYKETFFPSVTDVAKATIIEVTEGSVTNDVNIVLGRPVETFKVAGRVVDGETGRPIPNVNYGVGQRIVHDQYGTSSSSSSSSGMVTNANGEFRLDNVTPGAYTIYTLPPEGSDVPSASVTFDVVDRDRTDLLIKIIKGSSLSGVVVLEGNETAPAMLNGLRIYASVASPEPVFANSAASMVAPDGTFTINGVRSGVASFGVYSFSDNRKNFEILHIERNGIPSETINVKERENVAGIRVVVKSIKLTGAIRGQLKVENGEPPPISQISLDLWPLDESLEPKRSSSIKSPVLDTRGRFFAEGLPAGTYRLTVSIYAPGAARTADEKVQQVTVTDDAVTEVTVTIKSQPNPN